MPLNIDRPRGVDAWALCWGDCSRPIVVGGFRALSTEFHKEKCIYSAFHFYFEKLRETVVESVCLRNCGSGQAKDLVTSGEPILSNRHKSVRNYAVNNCRLHYEPILIETLPGMAFIFVYTRTGQSHINCSVYIPRMEDSVIVMVYSNLIATGYYILAIIPSFFFLEMHLS